MRYMANNRLVFSILNFQSFSGFRLGLGQPEHAIPFLPLATLLEQIDALAALQDVAFGSQGSGRTE